MQYFVYSDTRLFGICYNEHPGPVFPECVKPHATGHENASGYLFQITDSGTMAGLCAEALRCVGKRKWKKRKAAVT